MSERFQTPATALPPSRKAMQPNIFLSPTSLRPARLCRMRSASASSKAIAGSPCLPGSDPAESGGRWVDLPLEQAEGRQHLLDFTALGSSRDGDNSAVPSLAASWSAVKPASPGHASLVGNTAG